MTTRTPAEVQADLDELTARFNAAVTALKLTSIRDAQHEEWSHTVATFRGKQDNLVAELRRARLAVSA